MKLNNPIIIVLFLLFTVACQNGKKSEEKSNLYVNAHKVIVKEVLQANSYTYMLVGENDEEYWIAVSKMNAEEGDVLYYDNALEMIGFESKDLGRVFEKVMFVQDITDQPTLPGENTPSGMKPQKPAISKQEISIEQAEGGISIAGLFADKQSFSGQSVMIKGQVTKFNSAIMGKNWVHLQDGTEESGKFDLTVTTNDVVNVGDVVTFKGIIAVNKDFGAGYLYEVIMEDAVKVEKE